MIRITPKEAQGMYDAYNKVLFLNYVIIIVKKRG